MRLETAILLGMVERVGTEIPLLVGVYLDRLPERSRSEIAGRAEELKDSIGALACELRDLILSVMDATPDAIDVARMRDAVERKALASPSAAAPGEGC